MKKSARLAGAGLAVLTLVGAVACSDDDDKATPKTEDPGSPLAGDERAEGQDAAVCQPSLDYYAALNQIPEESPEMAKAFIGTGLLPAAESVAAALPADATFGPAIVGAVEAAAATGDPEGLFAPEVMEAQTELGEVLLAECSMNELDVVAVEYAFEGVPEAVDAGPTVVKLTNEGVEAHEMVLFRRNEGSTESLDEIMQLSEDEMMSKISFTGVTFGEPGSTSYTALDLEPGTYFLLCFIPVGGAEDGPPHFMEGMQKTITVA